MGKATKGRKHAASGRVESDPTGQSQSGLIAAAFAEADASTPGGSLTQVEHQRQNQQLLEKLSGSDVQKAVACSGIAHVIANQLRPTTSVLTPALLKKLLPLLLERTSYDVAISAAGAFRNISAVANAVENAKGNPLLTLLLNSDACTVAITLLEAERTEWIAQLPIHAPTPAAHTATVAGVIPTTPSDKRYHFLSQIVSGLANLSEQFDVVLNYLLSNSAALQHLIMLLLVPATLGASANTSHGIALQVEISNLLLLVSEGNDDFAKACQKLPAGFGGVAGVVTKLMQRIDPTSTEYAASPQVRVHCAGILLNLQPVSALMSLAGPQSAGLPLPGTPGAVPTSGEQLCVTSILSTISTILDFDPLKLGEELVVKLRQDRAGVDAQLAQIDQGRAQEEAAHRAQAEVRYQAKMARKAALAAGGDAAMEDTTVEEEKGPEGETVAEESKVDSMDDGSAARPVVYSDDNDAMESTHSAAQGGRGNGSNKTSPEVLIDSQWSQHLEEAITTYRQYLLSIRIGLEVLTNMCSSSEDEMDASDSDSDSGFGPSSLDANNLGYIPKLILHTGILSKIVNKCHLHLNPELMSSSATTNGVDGTSNATLHGALSSIFPPEEVTSRIVDLIDEIRNRCINALNNMVLYLPKEVLPGDELGKLFTYGCSLISNLSQPYQSNVLLAVEEVSNLTSLLFQLANKDTSKVPCNKEVVMMLVQLGRTANVNPTAASSPASSSASATAAAVAALPSKYQVQLHVIGLLSLLGTKVESFPYNFVIGSVLLEVIKHAGTMIAQASASNQPSILHMNIANNETHFLECASESLNALIDVYSEDDRHVDAQKSLQMVAILEQFLPLFQTAIKHLQQQKSPNKVPKQVLQRLQENALNAKEFVKYKKAHL